MSTPLILDSSDRVLRHLCSLDGDVVCLQEVFGSYVFDPLVRAARALGWHVSHKTSRALGGLGQTSGLLTFSKHPFETQEFIRFDAECGEDTWAAKGLLYTTVRLPDGSLLGVVNTHLQADAVFASTANCVSARRAQFAQLTEFLRARAQRVDRICLGGDINMPTGSPQFEPWSPRAGTAPTHESGRALDAIWAWGCDDLVNMRRGAGCDARLSGVSDHFPIGVSWGIGGDHGALSGVRLDVGVLDLVDV